MPRRSVAGKRYAEAIAGIARQTGAWERWRQDLAALRRALEDRQLQLILESPRVPAERKQALLDVALGAGIMPETRSLLRLLAHRGRFHLLPDVIDWFEELANRAQGVRRYLVTSAQPLSDDQRARLVQRLQRDGGTVQLTEQVDPDLLGGLVIRHEDVIRDYSVRARLESLRERLN